MTAAALTEAPARPAQQLDLLGTAQGVIERTREIFPHLRQLTEFTLDWEFKLSLGAKLGRASRRRRGAYLIELNPHLMVAAAEQGRDVVAVTHELVVHEVAHVLDDLIMGRMGHGPSWRMLMKMHGYESPDRYHCVDAAGYRSTAALVRAWCPACRAARGVTPAEMTRLERGRKIRRKCATCQGELRHARG